MIWEIFNLNHVSVCVYVDVSAGAHGGQKEATDPLQLEIQVVVCCPSLVLC